MKIDLAVGSFDDLEWVKEYGKDGLAVLGELEGLDKEDLVHLLANYVSMSAELITLQESQRQLVVNVWAVVNHPSQAGRLWVRYPRDHVEHALDEIKKLADSVGLEMRETK